MTLCERLEPSDDTLPTERRERLAVLSRYIADRLHEGESARVVVVCTHNSRRSHIGQVWLATAAAYYGLRGLQTYSGGTEATAFHPNAVAALQRAGWSVTATTRGDNPVYDITWGGAHVPYRAYSKRYDATDNPQQHYAAVMVCTEADIECPIVAGCELRLSLPYQDPKQHDYTPQADEAYDDTILLIGREMLWMMRQVAYLAP